MTTSPRSDAAGVRAAPLVGTTAVPGDKSTTQRALLLGAVAEGTTEVAGALDAGDTRSTAAIVAALGARVRWPGAGGVLAIEGCAAPIAPASPDHVLDCGNAATAARLLTGLLAPRRGRWTLDGDDSLRRRPMARVVEPLRAAGARITGTRLPIAIEGAGLTGMVHEVAVPSAQVKSALLLAGLAADGPTTVVQHVPTRDHTERMLPRFGVRIAVEPGAVTVHPGPVRAARLAVPGDPSSAVFVALAALLLPGSEVWIRDVGLWPRRTGWLAALERAGADIAILQRRGAHPAAGRGARTPDAACGNAVADDDEPRGDLRIGFGGRLAAFDVAPADVPDLVDEIPALALAAATADGTSRFAGLGELRLKESDRVATVARLLEALGAGVAVHGDELVVHGVARLRAPPDGVVFDDHRLELVAAVAARACGVRRAPGPAADVSFPGFAAVLDALGQR